MKEMVVDAWHHRFFFHGDVDRMWVSGGEDALSEKCIAVCVSHIGYIRCAMVAPRSIRDHWSVSRPFLHVQCDGHTVGESVTTGGNDSAVVGRVDTTSGTASSTSPSLSPPPSLSLLSPLTCHPSPLHLLLFFSLILSPHCHTPLVFALPHPAHPLVQLRLSSSSSGSTVG